MGDACRLCLSAQAPTSSLSSRTHTHTHTTTTTTNPSRSEGASQAFDMVFYGGKADDITVLCAAMH